MKALDQLLRMYQRTAAAAVLAVGYWLILLFTLTDEPQLGMDVFRIGILTVGIGSAVVLNWMGGIDAVLLYTKSGKRQRHPGKFWLCLRAVLHAYGSLALLMLSWRIFGYFTDSVVQQDTCGSPADSIWYSLYRFITTWRMESGLRAGGGIYSKNGTCFQPIVSGRI